MTLGSMLIFRGAWPIFLGLQTFIFPWVLGSMGRWYSRIFKPCPRGGTHFSDLFGAELMTWKWGITFGHFGEAGACTCTPRSSKGCWMDDKGCRKTPSIRVQTAPFGRCWYIHILFLIHIYLVKFKHHPFGMHPTCRGIWQKMMGISGAHLPPPNAT